MTIDIFLGTIIPLLFMIIILKGDSKLIMAFFSWGLIAFAISLLINTEIAKQFSLTPGQMSTTWAPIVEELFKALPLALFLIMPKDTGYPIVYYAMAAGIGFSIQENYLYLTNDIGLKQVPILFIVIRSITTCLMHGMSTTMIGYGLSIIRKIRFMMIPTLFGLFSISVIFHALFNLYVDSTYRLLGMVLPILLYMLGALILASEGESSINKKDIENQSCVAVNKNADDIL